MMGKYSLRIGLAIGAAVFSLGFHSGYSAEVERTNVVHYPPANSSIPAMMRERHRQQTNAAAYFKAFHDFSFMDRTAQSGITFEQRGVEDTLQKWTAVHYDHGSGLAIADVDADGKLDIYFVNQLGANELWRNLGAGKFENITAQAGVALADKVHVAASFADTDNDGDPDLLVTTVAVGNVLFENIGHGRFRDVTQESGIQGAHHSSGAVFFDYDRDGLLDLFICNVGVYTQDKTGPGGFRRSINQAFHGHLKAERSETSVLYRNLGQNRFRDVSRETGLVHAGWSGDAVFADVNNDGFPDLYVLNMQGDDRFYENQGGKKFVERTAAYFPKTPWGSMGAKFFDFNLDGRLDLFITDMHSDMTDRQSRIGQNTMSVGFEKTKSEAWCTTSWDDSFLQGASNNIFGNAFYINRGTNPLEEASQKLAAETYWPWGPSVGDLNADGYEDIFVTAGMGWPMRYGINSVLLNENGKRFFDAEFVLGVEPRLDGRVDKPMFLLDCNIPSDRAHQLCRQYGSKVLAYGALSSRASAVFDIDDDGDLDIVTNEMNDRPMVLVSNLSERKSVRFLKVKLIGADSNRDGIGATVKVTAGPLTMTQLHDGKSGYLGQSVMPLYFGLGAAERASAVEVTWPTGRKQFITNGIPNNALLTIRESK
jgi:enediyne biosynthesis protein E4